MVPVHETNEKVPYIYIYIYTYEDETLISWDQEDGGEIKKNGPGGHKGPAHKGLAHEGPQTYIQGRPYY